VSPAARASTQLMHAPHGSLRRGLGHCRSATLPGTTSCAATRVIEVTRFIREDGFTGTSSPGVSPRMRAAMVGLGLALAQPDRRVLVVKPATARY
jgi:hypothetical protein